MPNTNPHNVTLAEALAFIKGSCGDYILHLMRKVAIERIDIGLDDREFDVADAISLMTYEALSADDETDDREFDVADANGATVYR